MHVPEDDPTMDRYVAIMDRHGVEAALVHGMPPSWRAEQGNAGLASAVTRHKGRLYGSCNIDLRCPPPKCIRLLRKFAGIGFKCVKLFPNVGFDPSDKKHEPFWRAVEDAGMAVLSHCGWISPCPMAPREPLSTLTASPYHFEVPARMHPGINFIFAHFGGGSSYLETVTLISRLPNCYADTCPGWGKWVWEQNMPGLKGVSPSKILYGTDGAGETYTQQYGFWKKTLRPYGFKAEDFDAYFYGNALRVLRLAD